MPRSRSRTPPRRPIRRSRSRTPVMDTFSGISIQPQAPRRMNRSRRLRQTSPARRVPGQVDRNESLSSVMRRLNFDSIHDSQVAGSRYQQRVMSPRRSTKFWTFDKSGKRKMLSRKSFLRRRRSYNKLSRKSRKPTKKSRKPTKKSRKSTKKSRKSTKKSRKSTKKSRKSSVVCYDPKFKNLRTIKGKHCPIGWIERNYKK